MGYLAYGAMAGVGKEFLKQSEETRKRDFTLIRDKRLKEMQGELIDQRQGHLTAREEAGREFEAGQDKIKAGALKTQQDADRLSRGTIEANKIQMEQNKLDAQGPATQTTGAGAGSDYWDVKTMSWKPIRNQPNKPTVGSAKLSQFMMESVDMRGEGGKAVGKRTRGDLQAEWFKLKYRELPIDPAYPMLGTYTSVDESISGWIEYHNSKVTDQWKLAPDDPQYMQGDPDALLDHMSRNVPNFEAHRAEQIERLKVTYPWWKGPAGDVQAVNPGNEGPDQGALPVPDKLPNPVNNEGPNANQGMLSQSTDTASQSPGRIVESSRDIQSVISRLENQIVHSKGPKGDSTRIPGLQQQLNQYKILLQRALAQESQRVSGGPSSVPGSAPQPPPTQMAQR